VKLQRLPRPLHLLPLQRRRSLVSQLRSPLLWRPSQQQRLRRKRLQKLQLPRLLQKLRPKWHRKLLRFEKFKNQLRPLNSRKLR
jgi:hypothetical protein